MTEATEAAREDAESRAAQLAAGLLGHSFRNRALLLRALIHRSADKAGQGINGNNERLEFLGDRVLGLVVADMLFRRFPEEQEGDLARRHAALVSRDSLAKVASRVGLGRYLIMSRGEEDAGGRENPGLIANACEAVIGALFADAGLDPVARFIRTHWTPLMEEFAEPPKDPKTELQEFVQTGGQILPVYEVVSTEGPPHDPVFHVRVSIPDCDPASGTGGSKRSAERAAAKALLRRIKAGGDG